MLSGIILVPRAIVIRDMNRATTPVITFVLTPASLIFTPMAIKHSFLISDIICLLSCFLTLLTVTFFEIACFNEQGFKSALREGL